jgi:lactoylglutathione lyase
VSTSWTILSAQHVGLHVADLDRSLHFYRDLLGFDVAFQWNPDAPYIRTLIGHPNADVHAAILRQPGSTTLLELLNLRGTDGQPVDAASARPGTAHVAFTVTNLESLYKHLLANGVESVSAPVTPTIGPNKGGRAVYVLDPDGIRVELIETSRAFDTYDPATEGTSS